MNTTETPPINSNTALAAPALPLEEKPPQPAMTPEPITHQPSTTIHHPTIARLPKPTRDMLNLMLDDGLPYHVILDELGETAQGLSANGLAQWVKAGYADYLKERQTLEDVKTESEFAADLLRELGNVDPSVIHRACVAVANLQLFRAIREFGDEALRDMLQANPSSYLNLLNTLCNMVQPTIDLENHRRALEKD